MPKIKTNKSAIKRIAAFSAKGKLLRRKMSAQHLTSGKSKRSLRSSGNVVCFTKNQQKKLKKLIPYI